MAVEIEVKTKVDDSGVKSLKQELREAVLEAQRLSQADVVDQEKLSAAIARAGRLKDAVNDVNEAVGVLAGGSKFEQISNNLGDIGGKIASLDFSGANESAQRLVSLSKTITFKEASEQVKNLGSTFLNLGKSLLTNPLFLIGGVITGIVLAIGKALDKLGILKKITESVGKVFDYLINQLTDAVALVTDFFGITSKKERELAEALDRRATAYEKLATSSKKKTEETVQGIDNEIKIAELQGKSTEQLERKKLLLLRETAKVQSEADKVRFDAALKKGELDAKEIADLKEKARVSRLAYNQSVSDIKIFEETLNKERSDARKKDSEDQQKANEAAKQKRLAYEQDRLNASRLIKDLELANLQDGLEKELALNEEKYRRLKEDTLKNEKLTREEKKRIGEEYTEAEGLSEKAIRDKYRKIELDAIVSANRFRLEQDREFQDTLDGIIEQNYLNTLSDQERELRAVQDKYFALEEAAIGNAEAEAQIREAKLNELNDINTKYAQQEIDLNDQKNKAIEESDKQRRDAQVAIVSSGLNLISSLTEAFGKGSEAQQKKSFNINKGVAIAQATVDTYKAANSALATYPPPFGPIAAGIAIAAGLANVAKIASQQFKGSSGGGGTQGAGSTPSTSTTSATSATPSFSLFGQGNKNNTIGSQEAITSTTQNIQVGVSVEEITNTQNKINKYKEIAMLGG